LCETEDFVFRHISGLSEYMFLEVPIISALLRDNLYQVLGMDFQTIAKANILTREKFIEQNYYIIAESKSESTLAGIFIVIDSEDQMFPGAFDQRITAFQEIERHSMSKAFEKHPRFVERRLGKLIKVLLLDQYRN